MGKTKDLTGKKFGKLSVVEMCGKSKAGQSLWLCVCDCGNKTTVQYGNLTSGYTKSCGCLRGRPKQTGMSHTRIYHIWYGMKQRCYNPKSPKYKNWGGRGITLCDEWKDDFFAFRDWAIANGYREDLTIDRINVNGNYEPSNCRWATLQEQGSNKRTPLEIFLSKL